jgi:hypothetical protein
VWAVISGNDVILLATLHRAATAVVSRSTVDADATGYSLVGGSGPRTDDQLLDGYLTGLRRRGAALGAAAAGPGCGVRLLPADVLPRTPVGAALARVGLDPAALNGGLRAAAVVLFQGGAVLGTGLLGWRVLACLGDDRPAWGSAAVLTALGVGALIPLVGTVVAPQVSDDYGPLRLFQQSLGVLSASIVTAVGTLRRPLGLVARGVAGPAAGGVAGALVVGCLLTTTGVVPQLTGDFPPQLNLNNAGPYYRAYYAAAADLRAAAWTRRHVPAGTVVAADSRDTANLRSLTGAAAREGLAPGAVPAWDLVQVATPDGRSAVATAVVGDRVLRYAFPLGCAAAGRPLLHADGGRRLYGPVPGR